MPATSGPSSSTPQAAGRSGGAEQRHSEGGPAAARAEHVPGAADGGQAGAEASLASPKHDPASSILASTNPNQSNFDQSKLDSPPAPLRPLTSLRWPYVPDESAYPDPLKRDDPKPLTLPQYEAIATAPAVRTALAAHLQLPTLLRTLDVLRGPEREDALQRALGVSAADLDRGHASAWGGEGRGGRGRGAGAPAEEDVKAMRALAEAVEGAVRGGKEGALGLDWEGGA